MQTSLRQKTLAPQPRKRPEYVAVVRFFDDIDDARDLVRLEVGEARAILIAERG